MEAKIDKLLSLIEGSEKRMAQEMADIKLAVDTIKPDITALQGSVAALQPDMQNLKQTLEAWKPEMEAKVGDLGSAVTDLRRQVDHIAKGVGAARLALRRRRTLYRRAHLRRPRKPAHTPGKATATRASPGSWWWRIRLLHHPPRSQEEIGEEGDKMQHYTKASPYMRVNSKAFTASSVTTPTKNRQGQTHDDKKITEATKPASSSQKFQALKNYRRAMGNGFMLQMWREIQSYTSMCNYCAAPCG